MLLDNIKQLCEKNNTNFAEVERAVGLGNGVIGKWKESSPRLETIQKVAAHFGVKVDDLLQGGDSNKG